MKIIHKTKKKEPSKSGAHHPSQPTHGEVQLAAYYRWVERGMPEEDDGQEDWYQAENKWRDNIVPANND